jgi:hypothetical protein
MKNLGRISRNVKHVLVLMAVNDTLPSDMTQLDIDRVFAIASAAIKSDEYICTDTDEETIEYIMLLIEASEEDDSQMIDHIGDFSPVEKFEYTFTIRDFLEHIGL